MKLFTLYSVQFSVLHDGHKRNSRDSKARRSACREFLKSFEVQSEGLHINIEGAHAFNIRCNVLGPNRSLRLEFVVEVYLSFPLVTPIYIPDEKFPNSSLKDSDPEMYSNSLLNNSGRVVKSFTPFSKLHSASLPSI